MTPVKTFPVLGETVEILISGETTGGNSVTLIQISPPGGGPPPHRHENEDETFFVLDGQFEFFKEGQWIEAPAGTALYGPSGHVHTFRNAGDKPGRMLITASPATFETYLEEISPLTVPRDMAQLLEISARYGISFPPPAS